MSLGRLVLALVLHEDDQTYVLRLHERLDRPHEAAAHRRHEGRRSQQPNLSSRSCRRIRGAENLGTWEVFENGKRPSEEHAEEKGSGRRLRPSSRVYDLRHVCATLLLKQEVNPKIVSKRLGHAGITLRLDT